MNSQSTKDWSEVVKNYAQVIAFILAGWWTYHLFIQKDVPSLEARGEASSSLNWYQIDNTDKYFAEFNVILDNKGTTSFDISRIHVRGWEVDIAAQNEQLMYFDPDKIQSSAPFFDRSYQLNVASSLPFPAHYPPGDSIRNGFSWLMKRDCKKALFFTADFYKQGKEDAPNWTTYSWGEECSGPKP